MDALIAAAIHDAKNGLHALCAELAAAEALAPGSRLGDARILATQIDAQLVELLALYRASSGQLGLAIADRDVAQFIDELQIEPLLPGALRQQVQIVIDNAAAERAGIRAFDAYLVRLVLLDALRNGARHARSRVELSIAVQERGGIEFTIRDDGPGFPDAVLAGEDRAMQDDSSGLGLLFARLTARHHTTPDGHHGALLLDNQGIDGGARLRLQLP